MNRVAALLAVGLAGCQIPLADPLDSPGSPGSHGSPGAGQRPLGRPIWPMPQHDAQGTSRSELPGPQTPAVRWTVPVRAERLLVGADGTVYGITSALWPPDYRARIVAVRSNGEVLWERTIPTRTSLDPSGVLGSDGTIILENHDELLALDTQGTLRWAYAPGDSIGRCITTDDGTIYLTHGDRLESLTTEGRLRWSVVFPEGHVSQISIVRGHLVILANARVPDLPPNTSPPLVLAEYGTEDGHRIGDLEPRPFPALSFVVDGNGNAVPYSGGFRRAVGADDTLFSAFENRVEATLLDNAWLKWRVTLPAPRGGAVGPLALSSDGTLYASLDQWSLAKGNVFAISPDGQITWAVQSDGHAPLALGADAVLFVGGASITAYGR